MIFKDETPLQFVASCIWNLSEKTGVGLGRFAPIIFGWMLGVQEAKKKNQK